MSKARSSVLLAMLALAGGALYSRSSGAQSLPSTKVSSALAPLFKKARERDILQEKQSQDFIATLGQVFLGRGRKTDDRPYSKYVLLAQAQQSSAEERKTLQRAVDSGFLPPDELAYLAKKLEALEVPKTTP
jgi:hypothetical protein